MAPDRSARPAEEALDVAALAALVAKYDLRWAEDPALPYPAATMGACGRGWLPVVEALVVRLIELGWDRRVEQVKEKFGGLRFYVVEATPAMEALIAEAQDRSTTICEVCGAAGTLREGAPTAVRCDLHAPPARLSAT